MRFPFVLMAFLPVLIFAAPCRAADAPAAGKYTDGKLTLDLADSAGALAGSITLGSRQFPATAHSNGHGIEGTFTSGANSFPFTAVPAGDTLTLTTGSTTYTLKRIVAAVNPLDAVQPENPLNDPLAGYTVVASTDFGKSLVTQKADAASIQIALEVTFPDLRRYFGEKPTIGRAYESAADHKSGGATFTASLNGQPVRGFVSCKLNDTKGATVAVIYCRSDAPPAEWDKLMHPPAAAPAAPDAASVLGANAQVYRFPDGTGSITLADGWKTEGQSLLDATFIKGPGDQDIAINSSTTIQTKDSPLIKMMGQNEASERRMGMKPPPRPPLLVADFTDPVQAMLDLNPQFSTINQARGGPSTHIEKIIMHKDLPSPLNGGKSALIQWEVTRTLNGKSTVYRGQETTIMALIQSGGGVWMYSKTGYTAPTATFDQDQPLMEAMIHSINLDKAMFMQRSQERNQQQMAAIKQMGDASAAAMQASHDQFMKDQAQRFADGQARHQEQLEGYAQHNAQFQSDELQKSRAKDNFVETIQGTRTVYDTQTGASAKVDLNSAGAIVDQMNTDALDPNRFVQIPLRDEMDPVPAGK